MNPKCILVRCVLVWVVCARACVRARGFHALSQLPDRVQGVTNFERALTIADDGNADAQNEYGILLTKRAQRILKQLRREGFDPAAVNHTPAAPAEPQPEADPSSAESSAQPEGELPIETEEEKEAARRAARCAELVARANRYFDAAEAKFVELYETSVWFGTINLACLAALRGREEETRRWLGVCRDQHDLAPEHLDDHDFDAYRDRAWFCELRAELVEQRLAQQREEEAQREAELRQHAEEIATVAGAVDGQAEA